MTEFVLVRHALPVAGHPDPELSAEGREQARRLGRWLAAERFDALVASPLRRAVETAAIVAAGMGSGTAAYMDELRELVEEAKSDEHYVPAEQLFTDHPIALALAEGRYEDVQPRHEWDNFRARAQVAGALLLERYPTGRVLVVAHGGIINALLASILKLPGVFWFYPGYTSMSRMESLPSGRLVVRSVNETPHLTVHLRMDTGM